MPMEERSAAWRISSSSSRGCEIVTVSLFLRTRAFDRRAVAILVSP